MVSMLHLPVYRFLEKSEKRVIEKRVIYLIQLIGHFKKEKG